MRAHHKPYSRKMLAPRSGHMATAIINRSESMRSLRFALCLLVAAAASLGCAVVCAQGYPAKPVRLISPGTGATELVARIVAQGLSDRLGQPFFVDLRVGAGGNIGAETAARAPADGYTLFLATQPHTVNVSLYKKLTYDFVRDFVP